MALGLGAGLMLTTGSDNVHIASHAVSTAETGHVRIGTMGQHSAFFAQGIRGVTTNNNNAQPVLIDSAGQLGTASSSRRTKFDIDTLDTAVVAAVQRLRPVQFRYIKPFADGSTPLQYGLVAEEVADVLPELVVTDGAGSPESVKYHVLPSLLLAEVQRLERERAQQAAALVALRSELLALRAFVGGRAADDQPR